MSFDCRFDVGNDGFIDLEELKRMMEVLGAPQTHLALKQMIKEVDEDLDKKISFREFMLIYRKARAGELDLDGGLSKLASLTEIDVDEAGVGGAKNFFEAKVTVTINCLLLSMVGGATGAIFSHDASLSFLSVCLSRDVVICLVLCLHEYNTDGEYGVCLHWRYTGISSSINFGRGPTCAGDSQKNMCWVLSCPVLLLLCRVVRSTGKPLLCCF
ncbi:EF-hand domain-containing protein D2 [Araneus ventricosus]|uniref:EF-hand domain-containing protein D2 n=1 Tax=Araneus ventricosus TaxID=182803 RepID=A0A4Y2F056_ARAVE|nr:EF-hand domain-containing protein D2 [Araneus ventricosus]